MNAVLHESMYATPVCCASSLPYDTEWTSGDDAFEVISFAQSSSEYLVEYTTVSGTSGATALMYSMSSSDSTPASDSFLPTTVATSHAT